MHVVSGATLDRWTALSDEEIVSRVVDGQTALYEVLMRRHNERIYRAARAIIKDEDEAEDVMQQAYVNAYFHLRQFDRRAKFSTWLTKIAVHEALARARKRGRYQAIDFTEEENQAVERQPSSESGTSAHLPASCGRSWNRPSTSCRTAFEKCSCCGRLTGLPPPKLPNAWALAKMP